MRREFIVRVVGTLLVLSYLPYRVAQKMVAEVTESVVSALFLC